MGLRGPAPQPTALKVIRGNPGKRPLNAREPKPQAIRPTMPPEVRDNKRAAREWRRLCPILERMKILTEADGIALAGLCIAVAEESECQSKIDGSGLLIETKRTGMIRLNPLIQLRELARRRRDRLLREFGFSPSSRSSLVTNQNSASNDEWDF